MMRKLHLTTWVLGFLLLPFLGWSQVISTFPYTQDFESFSTCGTGCTSVCNLTGGWINDPNDDQDWAVDVGGTSSSNTGPSTDHNPGTSTGKYLYTETSGCNGNTVNLVSPYFDFTNLSFPQVSFWYHMFGATMGTMHFDVEVNGVWTTDIIPSWTDNQNLWQKRSVNLCAYGGQDSVRFRVRGITGSSFTSDMAVDDFRVEQGNLPIDAAVTAISISPLTCASSSPTPISITVTNSGSSSLTNIPVAFTVTGATVATGIAVVAGTLPACSDTVFTFTLSPVLNPGINNVVAYVYNVTGDTIPGNDSIRVSTQILANAPATYPYFQDFESGSGGWLAGGTNSTWALGAPNGTIINSAASGSNAWVTNLSGFYNNSENSFVIGPCFDFSSLSLPTFEASIWWQSEPGWDGANLQSSIDGGATWQLVGALGDPDNWYNDGSLDGRPGGELVGWGGRISSGNGSAGWVTARHALTGLAGQSSVLLRINFGSDGSVQDEGFAFDNVRIYEPPPSDIGVQMVMSPTDGCLSGSETITVEVRNFGSAAASGFQVGYQVTDPVSGQQFPVIESYTGPVLAPAATELFTFSTPASFANPGTYMISGFTVWAADADNSNNGVMQSVFNPVQIPTPSTPYLETFESFTTGTGNTYPNGWTNGTGTRWWYADNAGTPTSGTGPSVDHTLGTSAGVYMFTESSTTAGSTFELVSTCIDLSQLSCPEVKFWYHMYGTNTGEIHVDVSTDGSTWDQDVMPPLVGQKQTSNAAPWDSAVGSLAQYIGQTVYLRFRGVLSNGTTSSDMAIDDVQVGEGSDPGPNVGVSAIMSPMTDCGLSGAEPVSVEVTNYSCSPISNVNVAYVLNGGTPVSATIAGPISAGTTVSYSFSSTVNVSTPGNYSLSVYTDLSSDVNRANDTTKLDFESKFKPTISSTTGDLVCINTAATLTASGNGDTVLWYADAMGGLPIGVGNTFVTPPLSAPDTFYASSGQYEGRDLVTTFTSNNGASGNMFDVQATGGSVRIDSFYVNVSSTVTADIEIFYKVGSYVGNTANAGAWISLGRDTVAANGSNTPTPVPIFLNVTIPQGQTYAFNVFSHSGGMRYTNGTVEGSVWITDPFLTVYEGIGTNSPFPTSFNTPRNWNGRIFYTATGCESDRMMVLADVHPTLSAFDLGPDSTICGHQTVTLNALSNQYPLSYSWSTGATTQNITVGGVSGMADTSTYTVTVSDTVGCSISASRTITATIPIEVTAVGITDVACFGDSTGAVDVTVSGGTAGVYTFMWSNGATTEDLTNVPAGVYIGMITDTTDGCTLEAAVPVNQPTAPLDGSTDAVVDVLCHGDSTGAISISITGGTQPYSYLWSNGDTTQDLTNLPAGSYTGTVTDANGCTLTSPAITVNQPNSPVAITSAVVGDESCPGDANGYIVIDVAGGTPPYSYNWSNGATTQNLTMIPGGSYTGTITDANGCVLVSGAVTVNTTGVLPVAGFDYGISGGEVTFTDTSQNATTYSWDFGDGSPTQAGANPTHIYLSNGTYTITQIVYNNCGTDTFTVTIDMNSVSVEEILNTYISVYPNPNNGMFTVEFSELFLKDVTIEMTDINGKRIYRKALGDVNGAHVHEVQLGGNLPQGVYMLNVVSRDGVYHQRIMLE